MDALPIVEESGLDYSSKIHGCMHACGHDTHCSNVLGCALILNELKDSLSGCVKFMFQPNEENEGGAKVMIDAGVLTNPKVDYALAIHCGDGNELYKEGNIVVKQGCAFASLAEYIIK
jgi:amidohydrolase